MWGGYLSYLLDIYLKDSFNFFSEEEKFFIKSLFNSLETYEKIIFLDKLKLYIEENKNIFRKTLYKELGIDEKREYEVSLYELNRFFPEAVKIYMENKTKIDKVKSKFVKLIKEIEKFDSIKKISRQKDKLKMLKLKETEEEILSGNIDDSIINKL